MPWKLDETKYYQGRDVEYPPSDEVKANMAILIPRVNDLIQDLPEAIRPKGITSGFRPGRFNVAAGGAPHSGHVVGKAVDLSDPNEAIDTYLTAHPELLVKHSLWREDPKCTKSWCHLDITARPNHTFIP